MSAKDIFHAAHLPGYLNLTQQLLSCASGEEPDILQANSELRDLGFLQVCEAIAAQLSEAGEANGIH